MNDKDWLRKIRIAFKVYKNNKPEEAESIDRFIHWLYQQYGIVFDEESTWDN